MKSEKKSVPYVVIKRLPRYYRYLGELLRQGVKRISSSELSQKMGVTASQIRQDFNCFGGFGQQGYGYNVETLRNEIGDILGLSNGYKTIIIGAGHLGHALANHSAFEKRGFLLTGIFDIDPKTIGTVINHVPVTPMENLESFCRENEIDVAVLSVPDEAVSEVLPRLINLKIKGIWNFTHAEINVPPHIAVENVNLGYSLMTLSYGITQLQEGEN
ncbi:MAG: redox-sensing transcriptional repressor Rex [Ruminococcaceae bacterium]|nr:redox-sensing transcriptional repressor Rex [Oscillospiraceae bacterium]